jgi:hypothetical protein
MNNTGAFGVDSLEVERWTSFPYPQHHQKPPPNSSVSTPQNSTKSER